MRRARAWFILALSLGVFAGAPATFARAENAPALTADQWRADLQYLAAQMPLKHKNLFHTMTPEAFHAEVAQLDADIPRLNADEVTVRLYALAALPHDSHTGAFGLPDAKCVPLRLRRYDDGIYVESAPARYAGAVGGKLISIGAEPAESVYTKLLPLVPQDTGNSGLSGVIVPVLMTMGHVLHGYDVTPSADTATFVVSNHGKRIALNLAPGTSFDTLYGHASIPGWVDARGAGTPPVWLTHPEKTFWSTYLPSTRTYYIQFNQVLNAPDETVEHFFNHAFDEARSLPVDKLVLDIRTNDGGNNYLIKPVIIGLIRLPQVDQPGHLFVITSRNTYSAAQNLVNRIELYTNAIFVGQPTGEHVNSYGDAAMITLPNSGIRVGMASVWWQDGDERDRRIETDPELASEATFADYVANRDPALDVIASYQPEQRLEDVLTDAVRAGGVPAGLTAYRRYASAPIHKYARTEVRINALGYKLLGEKATPDAIAIFAVNAEANPTSANAADSLGEAYAIAGDKQHAIASYQRALQINPNLASSKAALTRLQSQP